MTNIENYYQYEYSRIPWWHEAGHAVIALHYGIKVKRIGLDPLPHCIVSQRGLSKHERGVLFCAGAAMTKLMCGYEWGTDNDYKIASEYGDLEEFKAEAFELCKLYTKEAGYLVDSLSNTRTSRYEPYYDHLTMWDDNYEECFAITKRAELPQWQKKLVMKWAILQSKYPKAFSVIARIVY